MQTFDGDSVVSIINVNSQHDQQDDRREETVGSEARSSISHHDREHNDNSVWSLERNHRENGGRRSCNDREAHDSKDRRRKRGKVLTQSTGTLFGDGPEKLPKARKSAYWEREQIVDSATIIGLVTVVGEAREASVAAPEGTSRDDSETSTENQIDSSSSNRRRLFLGNIPAYLSKSALIKRLKENTEGFKEIVTLSQSEHGGSKKMRIY